MKREENNNSANHREIVRRRRRSSTTSLTLPIDLIIEILWRLQAETIAICRCVSREWASLLRTPHFTKSFLTFSSTRPRLLFTFELGGKWHCFSSPQPRNVGEQVVAADYHMGFSGNWYYNNETCLYVNGFIYLYDHQILKGKRAMVPVICNPSTGEYVHLPKVRAKNIDLRSFFGYDPIKNQLKVLCMTVAKYRQETNSREHQILTIGKGKLSWRNIECLFPHFPERYQSGVCINGVLYYIARSNLTRVIACFDVRSEKFRFIKIGDESSLSTQFLTLINYKGKLGALVFDHNSSDHLWVLDDAEKEIWSKLLFCLPGAAFGILRSVGATETGEIFWASRRWRHPFYVYYYNVERKSGWRVEIKGMEELVLNGPYHPDVLFTFTNHVENVMFLQ